MLRLIDQPAFKANCPSFSSEGILVDTWYLYHEEIQHRCIPYHRESVSDLGEHIAERLQNVIEQFDWKIARVFCQRRSSRDGDTAWSSVELGSARYDYIHALKKAFSPEPLSVTVTFNVPLIVRAESGQLTSHRAEEGFEIQLLNRRITHGDWRVGLATYAGSLLYGDNAWTIVQILKARDDIIAELQQVSIDLHVIEEQLENRMPPPERLLEDPGIAVLQVEWPPEYLLADNNILAEANSALLEGCRRLIASI